MTTAEQMQYAAELVRCLPVQTLAHVVVNATKVERSSARAYERTIARILKDAARDAAIRQLREVAT
jgi:hypothetical protein